MNSLTNRAHGFSLVEVVLAIGVIAFAIVAILGVFPLGLNAGHSAQDETRAPQIAQEIFDAISSQAPTQFNKVVLPLASPSPPPIDLSSSTTQLNAPAAFLYADNNGQLSQSSSGATYTVSVATNSSPNGFDPSYANQVTVRVVSPPLASPGATPTGNQTVRDYVRIISKY